MARSIVHPRLMERLKPHFQKQTGTIQVNTPTYSTTGAPVNVWTNVSGMVDVPCTIGPLWAFERRQIDMTVVDTTLVALLDGHYPAIQETHSFLSGGTRYDINGVEHDSQGSMTHLRIREVAL